MAYYNPEKWISSDDLLIEEIEGRLKMNKHATSAQYPSGIRGFKPKIYVEFDVNIREINEIIRMVGWVDSIGKISIKLSSSDNIIFRLGHFNHPDYHHNPNGRDIPPPRHIHFPTVKFSDLNIHHSYAYPVDNGSDLIEALKRFCGDANIRIMNIRLPLGGSAS